MLPYESNKFHSCIKIREDFHFGKKNSSSWPRSEFQEFDQSCDDFLGIDLYLVEFHLCNFLERIMEVYFIFHRFFGHSLLLFVLAASLFVARVEA
jgi:hypothetical protein